MFCNIRNEEFFLREKFSIGVIYKQFLVVGPSNVQKKSKRQFSLVAKIIAKYLAYYCLSLAM